MESYHPFKEINVGQPQVFYALAQGHHVQYEYYATGFPTHYIGHHAQPRSLCHRTNSHTNHAKEIYFTNHYHNHDSDTHLAPFANAENVYQGHAHEGLHQKYVVAKGSLFFRPKPTPQRRYYDQSISLNSNPPTHKRTIHPTQVQTTVSFLNKLIDSPLTLPGSFPRSSSGLALSYPPPPVDFTGRRISPDVRYDNGNFQRTGYFQHQPQNYYDVGQWSQDEDDNQGVAWADVGHYHPLPASESVLLHNTLEPPISRWKSILREHASIIPPNSLLVPPHFPNFAQLHCKTPNPLLPFPLVTGSQYPAPSFTFLKIQSTRAGNATSYVEIVRSIRPRDPESGFGLEEGSLWVLKRFRVGDGDPDSIRYMSNEGRRARERFLNSAKSQLHTEMAAYRRIIEAPRSMEKVGFQFLMSLEGVVTIDYEVGLVMPRMLKDLEEVISSGKIWPRCDVRRIVVQTALAIATLHSIGIIHNDIKAENILLDAKGNVKVADFGLSWIIGEFAQSSALDIDMKMEPLITPLNQGSQYAFHYCGTSGYMAPEKEFSHRNGYGIEVDWWALGCLIYAMELRSTGVLQCFDGAQNLAAWCDMCSDTQGRWKWLENHAGLSQDAKSLLHGLLNPDLKMRFGIEEVLVHPYFDNEYGTSEFINILGTATSRQPVPPCLLELPDYFPRVCYSPLPTNGTMYQWVNPYGACVASQAS